MTDLRTLFSKASNSGFYRWILNRVLNNAIPFNGPHRFRVTKIEDYSLTITAPYIRKNMNHVKGIHACALATVSEYVAGLSMARQLPPDTYRLIMKELSMQYHYQAKMDVHATYTFTASDRIALEEKLRHEDATYHTCTVDIHDKEGHHICTGKTQWQVKPWKFVNS